jgi:starch synthase
LSNLKIADCQLKIITGGVPYEQMPKIYQEADIFVHPVIGSKTWQEQFGMVLVEAMASGLPIVTTNCGSISEVVGEAGIVVDREQEIVNNLTRLAKDKKLRIKLGKMARARAEKFFDCRLVAKQYEKLLAKLAD